MFGPLWGRKIGYNGGVYPYLHTFRTIDISKELNNAEHKYGHPLLSIFLDTSGASCSKSDGAIHRIVKFSSAVKMFKKL